MYKFIVCVCVFTCIERVSAQFGSRGVVKLPDGWVYHDNQTLDASKNAARFALHQQHRDNERRVLGLQGRIPGSGGNEVAMKPSYGDSPNKVGREQLAQEVLAFGDTLYFNPPEENRANVKIDALETERLTGLSDSTPDRFDSVSRKLKPRRTKQARLTQSGSPRPQFKPRALVPETFNNYLSRFRPANDRSQLRARINIQGASISSASAISPVAVAVPEQPRALPFTSTSHIIAPQQPAAIPISSSSSFSTISTGPSVGNKFSFNFRVQH